MPNSMVLKIDVEGFKGSVIKGVTPLLEGLAWWRALIEFGAYSIRKAGEDPARVWGMLREFPGVVVGKPGHRTEPFRLVTALPATPPSFCYVVIGQGHTRPRS